MTNYEDEFRVKDIKRDGYGQGFLQSIRGKFTVLTGKLTSDGAVENNAPASRYEKLPDVVLTAATNNQFVGSVLNKRYRRLMVSFKAAVAVISYDWALKWEWIGPGDINAGYNLLGDETAYLNRWFDDIISWSDPLIYDGLVPYGEYLNIRLYADNNHATDPITLGAAFLFYDPVR